MLRQPEPQLHAVASDLGVAAGLQTEMHPDKVSWDHFVLQLVRLLAVECSFLPLEGYQQPVHSWLRKMVQCLKRRDVVQNLHLQRRKGGQISHTRVKFLEKSYFHCSYLLKRDRNQRRGNSWMKCGFCCRLTRC